MISPSLPHILPFWNVKKQKSLHSILCVSTFTTFQTKHNKLIKPLWSNCRKGIMWLWHDHLKTYFTELIQLKYKLILWIKTIGSYGLPCVVWLKSCEFSKRKLVLIVDNSHMMCMLQKFLNSNFLNFLSNWVNLLGIFERNPSLWNSCLMPWRPMV